MSSLGDSPLWTPPAAHVCWEKERRRVAGVRALPCIAQMRMLGEVCGNQQTQENLYLHIFGL